MSDEPKPFKATRNQRRAMRKMMGIETQTKALRSAMARIRHSMTPEEIHHDKMVAKRNRKS